MAFKIITFAAILVLGASVQSSLASCGCDSGCGSSGYTVSASPLYRPASSSQSSGCGCGSGSGSGSSSWAVATPVYSYSSGSDSGCGCGSASNSGSGSAWALGTPVYRVAAPAPAPSSGLCGGGSSSGSATARWAVIGTATPASNNDNCNAGGYIRVPDEAPRRVQIIRTGSAPAPRQSLPYQVQVPIEAAPCATQSYGVRVEASRPRPQAAPQSLSPLPYVVEVPREAPSCQLRNLPIKVTVPAAPRPRPQVLYNVGYAVEVPAQNNAAPKLCNLKAQVDRIVVPNPCSCVDNSNNNDSGADDNGDCPPGTPALSSLFGSQSGSCGCA